MDEKRFEEMIAAASEKFTSLAQMLPHTFGEERIKLQEEISRLSDQIREYAKAAARAAVKTAEDLYTERRTDTGATVDFWDLGNPKPRVYKKPDFDGHTVDTTVVSDLAEPTPTRSTVGNEKIPPRSSTENIHPHRTVTASYRRNTPAGRGFKGNFAANSGNPPKRESKIIRSYAPDGALIHNVTVRTWETENEFYGRFTSDALNSHRATPKCDPDVTVQPVPYLSYVPQYAHMNSAQVEYYRWLRENIRRGRYPECDLGYIQLYVYEIFNLPGEIDPSDGVRLLTSIWLAYRERHPRLDGYLCEWLADYCLTNGCSLPNELDPILHIIAPKAQFKEFYLDPIITRAMRDGVGDALIALGKTVIEVSSDYDPASSRYYPDNREAYDKHIPESVGMAVKTLLETKTEPFSLDRTYKMTRDSYCGAIVSSGIKKRVDIEFSSFTRRADVRDVITALVKYSENKLRAVLSIKSKLRVEKISAVSETVIDSYFRPLIPAETVRSAEDTYMPTDYLKLYESEDSGFDFGKAAEIERQSWVNTERLTGEEYTDKIEEYRPDEDVTIAGEITADDVFAEIESAPGDEINNPPDVPSETLPEIGNDIKEALTAALNGRFREYCRATSLHDGEVADRINTLFLEIIGDIVLEDGDDGYQIIEDYREDAENWLQTQ